MEIKNILKDYDCSFKLQKYKQKEKIIGTGGEWKKDGQQKTYYLKPGETCTITVKDRYRKMFGWDMDFKAQVSGLIFYERDYGPVTEEEYDHAGTGSVWDTDSGWMEELKKWIPWIIVAIIAIFFMIFILPKILGRF